MATVKQASDWYNSHGRLYSVCPECGGSISEQKRTCSDCDEDPFALCTFCEEWIPANSDRCPECGRSDANNTKDGSQSIFSKTRYILSGGFGLLGVLFITAGAALSSAFSIFLYLAGAVALVGGGAIFILFSLLGMIKKSGSEDVTDMGHRYITDMKKTKKEIKRYNGTDLEGIKEGIKSDIANADPEEIVAAGKVAADAGATVAETYQERKEEKNKTGGEREKEQIESYEEKIKSAKKVIWAADCPDSSCIKWGKIRYSPETRNPFRNDEIEEVGFTIIDRYEMSTKPDRLQLQCEECSRTRTIGEDMLEE